MGSLNYTNKPKPWMHYAHDLGEDYCDKYVCAHCGEVFYGDGYINHDYSEDFCSERCFEAWLENQSLEGLDEDEDDEPMPSADGSGR